jgi:hypothetical protein
MQLVTTLWEHTRKITDIMASLPSRGPCLLHGINSHVCFMYTASEDRSIKMWGTQRMRCERTITSNL